jgi:hypothetical protein
MRQMKTCRLCGTDKPLDQFGVDRSTSDELNHWCRDCVRKRAIANREKRSGSIDLQGTVSRVSMLVELITLKRDSDWQIEVPGTINQLIESMDLDASIMLPILKPYVKKSGRSRYRITTDLVVKDIMHNYLVELFKIKQGNQAVIEFSDPIPFSVKQVFMYDYNHRANFLRAITLQQ